MKLASSLQLLDCCVYLAAQSRAANWRLIWRYTNNGKRTVNQWQRQNIYWNVRLSAFYPL